MSHLLCVTAHYSEWLTAIRVPTISLFPLKIGERNITHLFAVFYELEIRPFATYLTLPKEAKTVKDSDE